MSVINQMLQGLDKGAQQQQADVEHCGAVIVAAPNRHNKLVILLLSSIVVFAALAGYLFVQKQSHAAKPYIQPQVSTAGLEPTLFEKPVIAEPVVTKSVVVKSPVAAVVETPSIVTTGVKKDPKPIASDVIPDHKVAVVHIEKAVEKTVKPIPVKTPKTFTRQVASVTPAASPETAGEDEVLIKAVTRTPLQQAQLYAKQAESALLAGDKERAKKLFTKVLSFDKKHNLSREKLAALLYGEQRSQSAVTLLQEGLSISPEYANFRLMLARIYLKNNNKPQAYYYLKPHQPNIDGNVDYYAILAGLAQNLGDLDTALLAYKKLTVHEPNRAKWWLGLGITADKAKQVGLALRAYQTAQNMGQLSASSRNYINTRITQLEKQ
ncbi:MAG: tetratricopeptide repeat protein [Moritella sp.]|uniref:tetratricopeptide repeat protein n=1 Tax=Moritella sp. TaxID=78556 RepID=UPI0029AD1580|nr:tetratricopeptide repeat protein [Moritella sp.]MDX2321286.1 tetratricopeptide repeat protein [Moritella sp.]